MDLEKFTFIKEKYGHYASWAMWANEGAKPKDNMGDLSVFDIDKCPYFLEELKPHIIFIGLNISGVIKTKLGNFHSPSPYANDYKIRYALKNTSYYGAYMTDIIKDFSEKISGKVMTYLRANKSFEEDNINLFREEINDLEVDKPKMVAFGNDTYNILSRSLSTEYDIVKIPHYSHYISKENYKKQVNDVLKLTQ